MLVRPAAHFEMICFFSTPTIDVEPQKGRRAKPVSLIVSINPFLSFRGAQHPQGVRRIRDGRIPSPRPKAFPWGKVVPQGPDEGNAEGLGTLASERI